MKINEPLVGGSLTVDTTNKKLLSSRQARLPLAVTSSRSRLPGSCFDVTHTCNYARDAGIVKCENAFVTINRVSYLYFPLETAACMAALESLMNCFCPSRVNGNPSFASGCCGLEKAKRS